MQKTFKLKNKVTIAIVSLLLIISGIFAGCGSKAQSSKKPSLNEINDKIKQAADISTLKEGDSEKLNKLYEINSDEIEEFIFYTAPTNLKADEILILKVKDAGSVNGIKDKITKRAESQNEVFKDYLPDESFLIGKKVLKNNEKYILFAVSKDAEKIEEAFDKSF